MKKKQSITLRVVFEGVCAFVPDRPFFVKDDNGESSAGDPSNLVVLLPDMRSASIADWEAGSKVWPVKTAPFFRAPHAPVLSLRTCDLRDSSRLVVDGLVQDPATGTLRTLHVLDYEILTLQPGAEWEPLTFEAAIPEPESSQFPGPCAELRRSLWWQPRMSEISPPHQWGRSDLQTAGPDALEGLKLTSRIAIPGGHLSLAGFNSDATIYWDFGAVQRTAGNLDISTTTTWERCIGNQIACEARFPGTEVQLRIDGPSSHTQTVTLQPPSAGDVVEVRIANAELEDVVLTPRPKPWTYPYLPSCDVQAVYRLTTAPDTKPWPVPLPAGPVGPREKPCPGMALSGWQAPREENQ